jgi:YesN/AraC family two-component response regulator
VIGVLVVDDQDLIRVGLQTLIDDDDGMTLVGGAYSGASAVAATTRES